MKVVLPTDHKNVAKIAPILTLEQDENEFTSVPKNHQMTFKLLTDPQDNTSTKYEVTVFHIDENSSLCMAIKSCIDLEAASAGMNITDGANILALYLGCLHGTVKTTVQSNYQVMQCQRLVAAQE